MTDTKPLVTCIILAYKKYDYLFDAIDSVLMQNYPNIELVIADDGSPDFPLSDVALYINDRKGDNIRNILVYSNERNLGTVKSYNIAISKSSGQYFVSLASDDAFYDQEVISRVADRFVTTGAIVLLCSQLYCDGDLRPLRYCPSKRRVKKIEKLDTPQKQFRNLNFWTLIDTPCGAATYFSRECVEKYGYYDEQYLLVEDCTRIAAVSRKGGIYSFAYDIVSVKYRMGGMSQENSKVISPTKAKLLKDVVLCFEKEILPYKKELGFWAYRRALAHYKQKVCMVEARRMGLGTLLSLVFAYNFSILYWNMDIITTYIRHMLGMDRHKAGVLFDQKGV
ncbi:MAG: glycosyltransferase [Oscillospiraceae bacterium]|nr:glycosyltransferase [Oscillospiraceae bacterium]